MNFPSAEVAVVVTAAVVVGANVSHAQDVQALSVGHTVTIGAQVRSDFLSPVGLYRTERRARTATVREDEVTETGAGMYLEATSNWTSWFRSTLGLRGDAYTFAELHHQLEDAGFHNVSAHALPTPQTVLLAQT